MSTYKVNLAIVIPYYKFTFFEDTLASLARQTEKRFNVYIGDDASPESPASILNKYEGIVEFRYKRFESNLGGKSLVKQWERCLAMAQNEEWIIILGDDDVLSENFVSSFYNNYPQIHDENFAVVRYATQIINEINEIISELFSHPKIEKSTDFLVRKFSKKTRSSLSEYIFKKSVLLETKFRDFPLAWHSDDMAILEFSRLGNVFSINNSIVYVRVSDLNISGNKKLNLEKLNATYAFFKIIFDNYWMSFSTPQKKILLKKYEALSFHNFPSRCSYVRVTSMYLMQLGVQSFLNFQLRALKKLLVLSCRNFKFFT